MKLARLLLLAVMCVAVAEPLFSQNKKFDKSLKKVDAAYASGSFAKAASGLDKLKKSIVAKMGQQNAYMPGLLLREARINLASGMLADFDKTLANALTESQTMY